MQNAGMWLALLVVGVLLVVTGFEGATGSLLAAVFAPSSLVDTAQDTTGGSAPPPIVGPISPPGIPEPPPDIVPPGNTIIPENPWWVQWLQGLGEGSVFV
jgi:hypothetical protein